MTRGLSCAGFDIDLKKGQAKENELRRILDGATLEVKFDLLCRKTGRLFIEYEQHGRPSGIQVTEATHWAFAYDDGRFLLIETKQLRTITDKLWSDERRKKLGGDYNAYTGVLLPIEWLVPPQMAI